MEEIRFSDSDDIVFNPKKYFTPKDLERLSPFQMFTGEYCKAVALVPHDCDCEYCDRTVEKSFYGETYKEIEEEMHEQGYKGCEIVRTQLVFFAKAVQQREFKLA